MRKMLGRENFANDLDYKRYVETYVANSSETTSSYSKAVMDLITMFIEEQSCDGDVIKQSEHYEKLSGTQVELAEGYFKQYYTLLNEKEN